MALVDQLVKNQSKKGKLDASVSKCEYFIFAEENWGQYLQISTYGLKSSDTPLQASQVIQFSPDAIKQLKEILRQFE